MFVAIFLLRSPIVVETVFVVFFFFTGLVDILVRRCHYINHHHSCYLLLFVLTHSNALWLDDNIIVAVD